MLRPQVMQYNEHGISICLLNTTSDFESECELLLNRNSRNTKAACKKAAARLRAMADALDIIAESDKPFHEETAVAAVRAVKQQDASLSIAMQQPGVKDILAATEKLTRSFKQPIAQETQS